MIEELNKYGEVKINEDMHNYNTFRIGGICKCLFLPDSITSLQNALTYLNDNNIKYFVIGNGSNIILNSDLKDLVIIKLSKLKAIEAHKEYNMLYAEAGAMLPLVANTSVEHSLRGLEFAIGIPGTIGGSIYSNAGAYNSCILDYVKSLTIINEQGKIETLEHEDIEYGYRTSMFKEHNKSIIVSAKFYLKDGNKEESLAIIKDRKERRLNDQPLEYPSAGSVFRNPVGDYAGRLIEECGLKGYKIGGAEVSKKHANFIINSNNATSEDVYKLINYVHDVVLEKTSVDLKEEQEYIGWE